MQDASYIRDWLPRCDHWCRWTKYRAKQQRDQLMAKLKKGRQGEGDEI
jgi:hypothetical protein